MKIKTIYLNASLDSTLDFENEKQLAVDAIENGYKLCFLIDLGLFSKLKKPLSNKSQYLSLELSLKHFKESLWTLFENDIVEVCLYNGHLDFSVDFHFCDTQLLNLHSWIQDRFVNIELFFEETEIRVTEFSELTVEILMESLEGKKLVSYFARDASLEYIHILNANLPDTMPLSLRLDAKGVNDPLFYALLTNREIYEPINLILTNPLVEGKKSHIAICLPPSTIVQRSMYLALSKALNFLAQKKTPCRLIPESFLISEWDLVDYLLVIPHSLKKEGVRKLQGFAAAGGIVVALGETIGIPGEITFSDFCNI